MAAEQHSASNLPVQPRLICCWCSKDMGPDTSESEAGVASSGMCTPCRLKETQAYPVPPKPRLKLVAHMCELISLGQLDTPGRLAAVARLIAGRGL